MPKGRAWTDEENKCLRENYNKITIQDLSKLMDRSVKSLYQHAIKLGVGHERKEHVKIERSNVDYRTAIPREKWDIIQQFLVIASKIQILAKKRGIAHIKIDLINLKKVFDEVRAT